MVTAFQKMILEGISQKRNILMGHRNEFIAYQIFKIMYYHIEVAL